MAANFLFFLKVAGFEEREKYSAVFYDRIENYFRITIGEFNGEVLGKTVTG